MTRVSVVLAVHNGEPYLRAAVDSILAQTYRDFEFIAIDDASTDRSRAILEGYGDPRIRVLRQERNRGLPESLNAGLRAAVGEYVARMDADDVAHPERFRREVDYLDRHPEIVLVGSRARYIDGRGRSFHVTRHPTAPEDIAAQLLQKNVFVHSSVMFRREPVMALGGYDPATRDAEDYALWLRLSEHHRLANLPDLLVDYRVHTGQISYHKIRRQRAVVDTLREQTYRRRRAAGLLPPSAPSPLPSLLDRLRGTRRTVGGDYVEWMDVYSLMGRDDLAQAMLWRALAAAPLNERLRDEFLARYLRPAHLKALRRSVGSARAVLRRLRGDVAQPPAGSETSGPPDARSGDAGSDSATPR